MKRARKVALINVYDFPKADYLAYWAIQVQGDEINGYRYAAQLLAYEPVGWDFKGKVTKQRPEAPWPTYPADLPKDSTAEQQDARRQEIARIYEAHPKPSYLIDEVIGVADTRDEADTAAQQWILERMPKQRRGKSLAPLSDDDIRVLVAEFDRARRAKDFGAVDRIRGRLKSAGVTVTEPSPIGAKGETKWKRESGYSLALGPGWMVGEVLVRLGQKALDLILMAIAYSTTVRNNRMNQVRDGIDGGAGAGLMRIYDGSRPATCGTATTLLAELTHSDPCAAAASGGALTMSAITADSSANATGTASWFRNVDSTGTCCVDGNVGTAGSDLNLNSTSISTGQQVSVTSYVLTEGNA